MAAKFGEQQVLTWRRSYDTPPPALARRTLAAKRATRATPELPCRARNA